MINDSGYLDAPPTFNDLRHTFIEYISVMPMVYNNEDVLQAYERMFQVIDKLEEKYG